MVSTGALPLNAFRRPTIRGYEELDVLDVPTNQGSVRDVLRKAGAVTLDNWQPGQKGIIAHRGLPGVTADGKIAPECSVLAFQQAYDFGLQCSEGDSSVDGRKNLYWFHDKDLIGWLTVRGVIEETDLSSLSREQLEYVAYEIVAGKRTGKYQRTGQYVASLRDVRDLLNRNFGQSLLDDCRDRDPPVVAAYISHLPPKEKEKHYVQILPFDLWRPAQYFIERVEQNNPAPDWKETVKLVPSPHPHALAIVAGIRPADMTVDKLVEANWLWMKSYVEAGLQVKGFHIPRNGAALDYVNDNLAHFKGRKITTHPDLAPFIQDKAEEKLQLLVKEHYPHLPVVSPSARPSWSENGEHYLSGFHNPDVLTKLDLDKPAPYYFLQAAVPSNHFRLGVDILVCDDVNGAAFSLGNETYCSPDMEDY